ncbi:MAG: hypothetical protein K6F91_01465 [Ruminococcus sp.]|nr:hypothetical protein [Ruminococcus sp.]
MLNVINPANVTENARAVEIPDAVIVKKPKPKNDVSLEKAGIDTDKFDEGTRRALKEYFLEKYNELVRDAKAESARIEEECKARVEASLKESRELTENAKAQAAKIVEDAMAEGEKLKEQARIDGFEEGKRIKAQETEEFFKAMAKQIDEIKTAQQQAFDEYAEQLKFFAVDVAEDVVKRKVESDDLYLENLVKRALLGFKDADYISVTMSENLSMLAKKLKEDRHSAGLQNAEFKTNLPEGGSVILEVKEQVIDASLPVQFDNIREYLKNIDEAEENDEQFI